MNNICKFFVEGKCKKGDECKFVHEKNVCRFYFLDGVCKKGDGCSFSHNFTVKKGSEERKDNKQKKRRPKNTESFEPYFEKADMLVKIANTRVEKYSEKLLENGTFTEAQFRGQVDKMLTKAGTTSTGIQTSFTELFTALPAKIQTGMDPLTAEAGFFTAGMEKLRATAGTKFGLTTGVADPNSILGITTGMLGGIGSSVATAFEPGGAIQTSYGTGLDAVNAYVRAKTTGEGPETTSSIFKQAITDAAAKMVAEANSKAPSVAAAAAALVTGINAELGKIQKDTLFLQFFLIEP
jgi:hypothetical protein